MHIHLHWANHQIDTLPMHASCPRTHPGEAIRVALDVSGTLAFVTCADGAVAIYDLTAQSPSGGAAAPGLLCARGGGHGEMSTAAMLLDGGSRCV